MTEDESWRRISPRSLSWAEVDPARHPFDAARAYDVVRALAPRVPTAPRWVGTRLVGRDRGERWRDAVSHALVDRYGRWACGWCWGIGEGDHDGGPVGGWCCVPPLDHHGEADAGPCRGLAGRVASMAGGPGRTVRPGAADTRSAATDGGPRGGVGDRGRSTGGHGRRPHAGRERVTPPVRRPVPRAGIRVREVSELLVAVADGRVAQPVTTAFAETYRHPDMVYRPIGDLPMDRFVPAWRRRDPHAGLREFLRVLTTRHVDGRAAG